MKYEIDCTRFFHFEIPFKWFVKTFCKNDSIVLKIYQFKDSWPVFQRSSHTKIQLPSIKIIHAPNNQFNHYLQDLIQVDFSPKFS